MCRRRWASASPTRWGDGEPELTERWISLNGASRRDLGHETFLLDSEPWRVWDEQAALDYQHWAETERRQLERCGFVWAFCKTVRKPYDIAVTSILLRCRYLAPEAFVIHSETLALISRPGGMMHAV